MKITNLTILEEKLFLQKTFRTAQREANEIFQLQVHIHSSDGKIGMGSTSATTKVTGETLSSIKTIITDFIYPLIVGIDIRYINEILTIIQSSIPYNYSAKAAVDMAIHDLYCKCHSIPLYTFLGVGKRSLDTSLTISIDTIDAMCLEVTKAVEQGFKSLKIKMGKDYKHDILIVNEINKVIDKNITLRLDANQGWSRKEAVKVINLLSVYDNIEFIEQPVVAADIMGLKWIKDRVDIPIMADESVFSYKEALDIIRYEAADIINIKLLKCGGIYPSLKIAYLSENTGIETMLGCMMEGAESLVYSILFAFSQTNIKKIDLDSLYFLKTFLLPDYIEYEKGKIVLNLQ